MSPRNRYTTQVAPPRAWLSDRISSRAALLWENMQWDRSRLMRDGVSLALSGEDDEVSGPWHHLVAWLFQPPRRPLSRIPAENGWILGADHDVAFIACLLCGHRGGLAV